MEAPVVHGIVTRREMDDFERLELWRELAVIAQAGYLEHTLPAHLPERPDIRVVVWNSYVLDRYVGVYLEQIAEDEVVVLRLELS